jgi:hypothetical protein
MNRAFVFLCIAALACAQEPQDLDLFLLIGQSNMAGRGAVEEQDRKVIPGVFVFTKSMEWAPAIDPLHFDKPTIAGVGLGRSFAQQLVEARPAARIGLIPAAFGGTALREWQPGGGLYDEAVRRTRAAIRNGRLRGILWHQGEADSNSDELAASYADRFAQFIAYLRQDLRTDVPVVVGELGPFFTERTAAEGKVSNHGNIVNQQLARIARIVPRVGLARAAVLKDKGDGVHFDSASLRELGRRYAKVYLSLDPDWRRQ